MRCGVGTDNVPEAAGWSATLHRHPGNQSPDDDLVAHARCRAGACFGPVRRQLADTVDLHVHRRVSWSVLAHSDTGELQSTGLRLHPGGIGGAYPALAVDDFRTGALGARRADADHGGPDRPCRPSQCLCPVARHRRNARGSGCGDQAGLRPVRRRASTVHRLGAHDPFKVCFAGSTGSQRR